MKILHLTNHLNSGGISSYVYVLACEMKRRGHQSAVLTSEGALVGRFQEAGISVYSLLPRTKSEIDPRLYFVLPRILQMIGQGQYDLLHAHTRVGQVLASWIKVFTGIPYVTTAHGFYKNRLGRKIHPAWGDHVIAISNDVQDHLIEDFNLPHKNVTVVFNGVDIESLQHQKQLKNRTEILKSFGISVSNPIVVSSVARIVPAKGHEVLLHAIARLIPKYPELHLILTGQGAHETNVRKVANELRLNSNITFTGPLEDITKTLAVTDIFVASVLWDEAFGLSIAEAMALKIPVVTSSSWSLRDVYKDHESVLVVPPGNVSALEKALDELISNRNFGRSLTEIAYGILKNKFSAQLMGESIEKIYKRVFYK
ncbi:MAG TPA: glycosyltransferase family 4 protein [Candidatus Omnitrophota bacterium]|nr:glycosyltransferase family 4 protein [Candidatus Omnitrophota bacterium]